MSLQTTTNLPVDDHDPAPLQSQPLSSGTESGGAPVGSAGDTTRTTEEHRSQHTLPLSSGTESGGAHAASGDGTRRTTGERHGQDDACIPLLQGLAPPTSWDNILSFAGGCLSFVGGLIGCVGAIVGCCCH